jgi:WD40 repeat protein
MPHLICTAGNDQHLRIWDVRHLSKLQPEASEELEAPKTDEGEDKTISTHPTSSIAYERVSAYMEDKKGKGLLRASFQHGKSCSAAYWDPFGRRILTTSYDDKLRIWTLNPQSFMMDVPLGKNHFQPSKVVPHDCQTGRWLTI